MSRTKREDIPLECEPWDPDGTPWGQEAQIWESYFGKSPREARDAVIFRYLFECGDLRPLQALFLIGEAPGEDVLKFVGKIMSQDNEYKYVIFAKGKDGNKVSSGEVFWRDLLLYRRVREIIKSGEKYDVAIHQVASELDMSIVHVRDVHDELLRKYGKNEGER